MSDIGFNVKKLYLSAFLINFVVFLPVIVIFWQQNGLNFTQIMILQAVYALAVIILELPTGAFADRFGRKYALTLAALFLAIGVGVYSIGHNFYHFLIAEIIWAIGGSLTSGTDSAMVYDTLKAQKKEGQFKKIWGTMIFIALIASAVASPIGGFIGEYSLRATFYVFVPLALIMGLIAFSLKEPPIKKQLHNGYIIGLKKAVKFALYKNKEIRWLIIYSALFHFPGHIAFWLYQPYFILAGFSVVQIGFVFAGSGIVAAIASMQAHKIEEKIGRKKSLLLLPILLSIALGLMALEISPLSLIFVAMLQFAWGYSVPVIGDYMNKIVWSDKRATVISLNNMVSGIVFAIFAPIAGIGVDVIGIKMVLLSLGGVSLIGAMIIPLFLKKNKVF